MIAIPLPSSFAIPRFSRDNDLFTRTVRWNGIVPPAWQSIYSSIGYILDRTRGGRVGDIQAPLTPIGTDGSFALPFAGDLFRKPLAEREDPGVRAAYLIIDRIHRGGLHDVTEIADAFARINAADYVDALFRRIDVVDVPPASIAMFRRMAVESENPNVVKWGIALGSITIHGAWIDVLMTLARHAEFTVWVFRAIVATTTGDDAEEELRDRCLLQLLANAHLCALCGVIRIAREETLGKLSDMACWRAVLDAWYRHDETGQALTSIDVWQFVDVPSLIDAAFEDAALRQRVIELVMGISLPNARLSESLADSGVLWNTLTLIRLLSPSMFRLVAAYRIADELARQNANASVVDEARQLIDESATTETLRTGLADPAWRDLAAEGIQRHERRELLPELLSALQATPSVACVEAYAVLAEPDGLVPLLALLPDAAALAQRAEREPPIDMDIETLELMELGDGEPDTETDRPLGESASGVIAEEDDETLLYAAIILELGALHTKEARTAVETAAGDTAGLVRAAAFRTMRRWPPHWIDARSRELLAAGLLSLDNETWSAAVGTIRAFGLADALGLTGEEQVFEEDLDDDHRQEPENVPVRPTVSDVLGIAAELFR